jgi:hypothetical protein
MRKLLAIAAIAGLAPTVSAQPDAAGPPRELAAELVRSVESMFECEISIHGEPRSYDLSSGWYVTYSASGDACDAASQALSREGQEHGILFSRRPNLDQLNALVGGMVRSVRSSTGCQINLYGKPRLIEASGQWSVSYVASGVNCDEAGLELARQGAELDILFFGRAERSLLR